MCETDGVRKGPAYSPLLNELGKPYCWWEPVKESGARCGAWLVSAPVPGQHILLLIASLSSQSNWKGVPGASGYLLPWKVLSVDCLSDDCSATEQVFFLHNFRALYLQGRNRHGVVLYKQRSAEPCHSSWPTSATILWPTVPPSPVLSWHLGFVTCSNSYTLTYTYNRIPHLIQPVLTFCFDSLTSLTHCPLPLGALWAL